MGKLDGLVVLVTGASSGMGRATALLFAAEGADVALVARRAAALEEVAAEARHHGRRVLVHAVDLADGPATRAAVDTTAERLGRLDVVINAAGTNIPRRALSVLDPADWHDMVESNLSACFHTTQAALPHMRQQGGGLLVYLSSAAVQRPDRSGVAYQATKHGQVGLAHGTMEEERENGIRTTVIFPGLTNTPLLEKRPVPTPPEIVAKALLPEDVAQACLFVASLPARVRVPELAIVPSGI
ncbi:MAG: SDR family oxidoreductase [Chloroflexi bacterium]|nr:SDR family oxidoreductase [Chloroflexota bacterium]